jgi:proton-translocating NADH-quinone oxidoreductase chain M
MESLCLNFVFFSFIGFFFLFFYQTRLLSYFNWLLLFISNLILLSYINKLIIWYQTIINYYKFSFLNISYIFGFDSISIFLIFLCCFLLTLCVLLSWQLRYKIEFFHFILMICFLFLLNIFLSLDLFIFYINFEAIVIPMFYLIGVWGSRARKIYAAYQFFIHTLLGSILILTCLLFIYLNKGSSTFDFYINSFFFEKRFFLFFMCFFLGFSIKVPIIPFHIWLPEAHVEAPTIGSVILAGILLKLGIYAMFRLLLPFNYINFDLIFLILMIAFIGFFYSSLVAFIQIDIKKIIAYSSIAHMNFSLLGLFSYSLIGTFGAFIMMFGHALTSAALFFGVGVLYDRYKTRLIFYYGALVSFMPIFSVLYFIFILANFGFPGTFNFVGEFLILLGGLNLSSTFIVFSTIPMILTLIYSLFLYNRLFFGPFSLQFIRFYCDCTRLEFIILVILLLLILLFGLFPQIILELNQINLIKCQYLI